MRSKVLVIHTNLSAILRVYNSNHEINVDNLEELCKTTYQTFLVDFPWASITPTLHKLLAHCTEIIRDCNDGQGLKDFSEECVESCKQFNWKISRTCEKDLILSQF